MSAAVLVDSAGHQRTSEQVERMARETLDQLSQTEIIEMLVEACGSVHGLPESLTRCDCHGLWYDECEAYR